MSPALGREGTKCSLPLVPLPQIVPMSCAAWLGFQIILSVLVLIRLREAPSPALLFVGSLYPAVCLWYLRRPQIAALFR